MKHTKSTATYIEGIDTVIQRQGYCRAVDLSREINITPGSTSTGLKVLLKKGMIEFDSNKIISLTDEAEEDLYRLIKYKEKLTKALYNTFSQSYLTIEIIEKQVEEIYFLMNEEFMESL